MVTSSDPFYFLGGMNIGVLNDTTLVIEPFAADLWQGIAAGWNNQVVNFQNTISVDLTSIGLNGRDAGTAGTPPTGCYKVWMIANPTTGDVGFIATQTLDPRSIVFPAGYTLNRKLPFGFSVIGGRALPFHAASWASLPRITFTDNDAMMTIWSGPANNAWLTIPLPNYIPENSRSGIFAGQVSGGSGSMWISPSSSVPNPFWKTLLANQAGCSGNVDCRVDGNQNVCIWAEGTGTFSLILRGYSQTEVT